MKSDPFNYGTLILTPEEFELEVKNMLGAMGADLDSFRATHREHLVGTGGSYEIDVVVRFRALGADFLVLVECKHQRSPVKRDVVQILHDRLRSVGAQKGILFATAQFQKGALEYAAKHGIALVRMAHGITCWHTRAAGPPSPPPPWENIPRYIGWWAHLTDEGNQQHTIVSVQDPEYLRAFVFPAKHSD
ncbi:MAG: restriction endonuclease [Phycisphaerales bacterium]|nr:restriction endonuclease [Phycisphaerales bacterium]MCI0676451.1 restriction endonuclease [Phycisphaerales bacterium]